MRRKELVFPSEGSLFFIRVPVIIIAVNSLIGTSRRRDSLKKKGPQAQIILHAFILVEKTNKL